MSKTTSLVSIMTAALFLSACGGGSGDQVNQTPPNQDDTAQNTDTVHPSLKKGSVNGFSTNKEGITSDTGGGSYTGNTGGSTDSILSNDANNPDLNESKSSATAQTPTNTTPPVLSYIVTPSFTALPPTADVRMAPKTMALIYNTNGKKVPVDQSYDAGMNGLKNAKLGNSYSQFGGVVAYQGGGGATYFRDPAVTGWKYQNIGHRYRQGKEEGYVSVGAPQDISIMTGNAQYKGIATGSVGGESEVVALMNANLDIAQKSLTVNITDSYLAQDNIKNGSFDNNTFVANTSYDLTNQKLTWQAQQKQFRNANMVARLYGNQGEEIGGVYQTDIGGRKFIGAFGGTKQ